jgi:Leucine-rich repeat (LRR) protein
MNRDTSWRARRLTKASIRTSEEGQPSTTRLEEPIPSAGEQVVDSVDGNDSDVDFYDNERPGAYAITRGRLMSLSSRNSEIVEIELSSRADTEAPQKHRCKNYLALFIVLSLLIITSIGIIFLVNSMSTIGQQDVGETYAKCFTSLQQETASNNPYLYCNCFEHLSKIDDEFWNVYNLIKSTRGITEYLNKDELLQHCSPANIAMLWITEEIRFSLNHDVYIDLKVIQTRFLLALLYITWNGSEWINQGGWLSDEPVCKWHGIGCENESSITEISLRKNNLQGTLDTRLDLLQSLKSFDLSLNKISGSIPDNLWSIPTLGEFDKSSFAVFLTHRNLPNGVEEEVQLNSNPITGVIRFEAGQVSALKILNFDSTFISGMFPFSSVPKLKNLSLSFTYVTGKLPNDIGLFSDLELLSLMGNLITGSLPSSLTMLTNLKNLSLSFTDFSGTLPESIGNMTSLGK